MFHYRLAPSGAPSLARMVYKKGELKVMVAVQLLPLFIVASGWSHGLI